MMLAPQMMNRGDTAHVQYRVPVEQKVCSKRREKRQNSVLYGMSYIRAVWMVFLHTHGCCSDDVPTHIMVQ